MDVFFVKFRPMVLKFVLGALTAGDFQVVHNRHFFNIALGAFVIVEVVVEERVHSRPIE